jgi:hypothetical protein
MNTAALSPRRHFLPTLLLAVITLLVFASQAPAYPWPVKPFDVQHPVRGYLGDPRTVFAAPPTTAGVMTGTGSFSFHFGVDISAPDGTSVYPVASGTVTTVTREWVAVTAGDRSFQYWHIKAAVVTGQHVDAGRTVLGTILRGAQHVHFTELEGGRIVNPLLPGHLTPYLDTTTPRVASISVLDPEARSQAMANFTRGSLWLVAEAYDTPALPVPGIWHGMPVAPALLTWRVQSWNGKVVVPTQVAADFRQTIPANSTFWTTYARGTFQNMSVFGKHYSYLQPGRFVFNLTHRPLDTTKLPDGVYDIIVTASDLAGNSSSSSLRITIHNRPGWIGS